MGGVAGQKQSPMTHGLGDPAPQRGDDLLDGGPGDQGVGHGVGKSRRQLRPETVVGPVVERGVGRTLDVIPAAMLVSHRAEGKAPLVAGVDQLVVYRRGLGEDPDPAERVLPLIRMSGAGQG